MNPRVPATMTMEPKGPEFIPEQRLFLGVILQAIADATAEISPSNAKELNFHRRRARDWLLSDSRDFRLVCGHAGLDAETIATRAKRLASMGWARESRYMRTAAENCRAKITQTAPGTATPSDQALGHLNTCG